MTTRWPDDSEDFVARCSNFSFLFVSQSVLAAVCPALLKAKCQAAIVAVMADFTEEALERVFSLGVDECLPETPLEGITPTLVRARRNALQRLKLGELRQAYRQLDERFGDALDLSSDWLWEQDENLVFSFTAVLAKSGLHPRDIIGRTRWELAGGDPEDPLWIEHRRVLERREPFRNFVYSVILPTGKTAWFSINGKPLFAPDGSFKGYRGTAREITEEHVRAERLLESEQRFFHAVRGSSAGIWDWKVGQSDYYMSARFKEMLGYADEELANTRSSFLERLHPEDRPLVERAVRNHFERRVPYKVQYRMVKKDGAVIWCQAIGQAVWDDAGNVLRFAGSTSDISAQKRAESRVQSLMQQQDAILEHAPVGIAFLRNGRIIRCNQWLSEKLGICREALQGTASPHPLAPRTMKQVRALVDAVTQSDSPLAGELNVQTATGLDTWIQYRASPLNSTNPDEGHVLVTLDITERKHAEQKLLHLAQHDALTDLPNRVLYRNILVQGLAQARRREWLVAVLFIDLDRFKHVNDSLGHTAGDRLLRTVAARVRECLRASDTIARLSGDEFGVILPDMKAPEDAVRAAGKILESLSKPIHLGVREVSISASIGIAIFPRDGADPDTLIANADAAMYQAKALGRSQYQFFTPELNLKATRFLELETRLRRAIAEDELELHYQPRASVSTGKVTGVEALLRWQPSPGTYLSPAEFIPVLEETGLILEVGRWVLQRACQQVKLWESVGISGLTVAVNVSARQLALETFADEAIGIIKAAGVKPTCVELEITESAVIQNLDTVMSHLKKLRQEGVLVALDDFGTGYSSLSYLKRLEVETLKLDRVFMRDVDGTGQSAALVSAMIAMAQQLHIKVVAEGVETPVQLEFLRRRHCDEYQGFLLAKPLPADQIAGVLTNRQSTMQKTRESA